MTSFRPATWRPISAPAPWTLPLRRLLAIALRRLSAVLARLAHRLAQSAPSSAQTIATMEFHADVGASDGALYVNGRLVGWIDGVRRL